MKYFCQWLLAMLFSTTAMAHAAVVLLYHHVSDSTPKSTSISPSAFDAQMDYLEQNHFKIVPLLELVEKLRNGESLPDKTVAITFDDSYASVYQFAYPKLKKRNWPFTFFVNTDSVGTSKLFVSWDQLREMSEQGVTIANHSSTHTHLPRKKDGESDNTYRQRIQADIEKAQQRIKQEIGSAPMILAYPFGEYNADVQLIAKRLGYIAFGQQSGALYEKGDLQAVPRFPFGGGFTGIDDFIMKVNTKPLPTKSVSFFANKQQELASAVVLAGDKPWLVVELNDEALLKKINCFATGQGAITTEIIGKQLWVQAKDALGAGRTRYNCTAYAGEKGRFYWYTQQWLATDKSGKWTYQD
ncbi:MAG TPA: polysaccharide deacetylase family protein [Cellvibrio sp.]|nr:polysaccharide deacetylase family protein [Cellvibrio sp.]